MTKTKQKSSKTWNTVEIENFSLAWTSAMDTERTWLDQQEKSDITGKMWATSGEYLKSLFPKYSPTM